jgi:hypothetical protein
MERPMPVFPDVGSMITVSFAPFGVRYHGKCNTIFDAPAGVRPFKFHPDFTVTEKPVDTHMRSGADGVKNRIVFHGILAIIK